MESKAITKASLPINVRRFVAEYTKVGSKTCGNAVKAYQVIFPDTKYTSCANRAHNLLKMPQVQRAVEKRLSMQGWNNVLVDSELLYVIEQRQELPSKVRAIEEYNRLQERIKGKGDTNINIGLSLTALFNEAASVKEKKDERDVIDFDLNEVS